jgi:two-component system cell cycle sensor histidine kinase PleC
MARADAASASARSDSIKGLAQSIANPAYRRLLTAEPALRRAVPALIIAFLLTIGVGAVVQVLDHRRMAIMDAIADVGNIADYTSERLDRLAMAERADAPRRELLERALPARAIALGRRIMLSNAEGIIIATAPVGGPVGHKLTEVLGATQPLTILGASAGVLEIELADGNFAFATVRTLSSVPGQIAVYQPRGDALGPWWSDTTLTVTLSATTGFVLLILGFAFHWQATRAREADLIYDTVRSRIDTALNRGRCGLWDWDLARGRIFWSHSMFAILGLDPRDDLLTFG